MGAFRKFLPIYKTKTGVPCKWANAIKREYVEGQLAGQRSSDTVAVPGVSGWLLPPARWASTGRR